jgi:hypothetical protein
VSKWDAKAMDNLRRVSSWLREQMMCRWKRKVVSSYITWMKLKYELEISSSRDDTVSVNLEGGGNVWIAYGQDRIWGQEQHDCSNAWWKDGLVKTYEDIVPASDAIAQKQLRSLGGTGMTALLHSI